MRRYRLRIGLDVDDTLYDCNAYALSIVNKNHPDEDPVSINEIKGWGNYGRHFDERIALYSDPEFVRTQPILPGAQKFVRELSKQADVFFVTAVPAACMSARAERLLKDFPEIPSQNIIIGTRKDVFALDMLLDDGAHNISNSKAVYPVLFRKPWNMDMSGILAVNSYSDFMQLFRMVRNSFVEKAPDLSDGGVICLVGPSGSLKNEIAYELTKDSQEFKKPLTSTTRPKNPGESDSAYRFIDEEQFLEEKEDGRFLETTVYSKFHFGTPTNEIQQIVNEGNYAVLPIDICGALTIRNSYRGRTLMVFVNREKTAVLKNIIARKSDEDDKVRRIMSLDFEYRNAEICDIELKCEDNAMRAAEELKKIIAAGNR